MGIRFQADASAADVRIDMSRTSVAFPAVINARAVRQWMDVVKLGVNYKFGWGSVVETY